MKISLKRFFKKLGPGFITGASDNDPAGIATYTQAGAQFGYGQLWTALFIFPLMTAIQEASARIGAVTGKGLAWVIKEQYGKTVLYVSVMIVLIANTINIGADLGAMAAAARLIVPIPFAVLTLLFTAIILILEIMVSYKTYAKVLKWFALALLSYPLALFFVREPWGEIWKATFIPHIEFNFAFLFIIVGVLGTTISPYLFFWQASEEIEEEKVKHILRKDGHPNITWRFIQGLRFDNFIGMLFSQIGTWCIMIVGASVLNGNGITNVSTAADAAQALQPLVQTFPYAGLLAKSMFALGVIGLGFLAVPVLSGSASYAVSETLNWKEGLNLKLKRAHGFYGIITIATIVGLIINFIGINPMKALIYASVLNGIAAVPLIFIIGKIARDRRIMGEYRSKGLSHTLVWITFFVMAISALGMFID